MEEWKRHARIGLGRFSIRSIVVIAGDIMLQEF